MKTLSNPRKAKHTPKRNARQTRRATEEKKTVFCVVRSWGYYSEHDYNVQLFATYDKARDYFENAKADDIIDLLEIAGDTEIITDTDTETRFSAFVDGYWGIKYSRIELQTIKIL